MLLAIAGAVSGNDRLAELKQTLALLIHARRASEWFCGFETSRLRFVLVFVLWGNHSLALRACIASCLYCLLFAILLAFEIELVPPQIVVRNIHLHSCDAGLVIEIELHVAAGEPCQVLLPSHGKRIQVHVR